MGSKGGSKYRVVDYYMGVHYGICAGPVDALLGVYIKERDAWPGKTKYDDDSDQGNSNDNAPIVSFKDFIASLGGGNTPTATSSVAVAEVVLDINRPDLFGGDKKEGGVVGKMRYLPGGPGQVLPTELAAKLKTIPSKAPGYRGVASAWFYGAGKNSFMWCQNNPYLPPAWFTVFRRPKGLTQSKATVQRLNYPPDANPAHMIYECMTNTDWGMGSPATLFNVASFEACGDKLLAEKFGLSMLWNDQATIEDFVKEIVDHVQATVFINPRTGLWEMKLIRGDYDVNTLRTLTPDNCDLTNRQRKAWAETINEVVVTWTNPTNEKEETVTFQDIANISMQGGVVSDGRNYYGIRNKELATEVGARDIRSASYPLFSAEAECDREGWDLLPGDCIKVTWPEDGIENVVCRIGKVDYGRPGDMTVKVSLVEDIFSLEKAAYTAPPTTGWQNPDRDPEPMAYRQYFTMPYPAMVAAGLDPLAAEGNYPRVVPGFFGQQNDPGTYNFDLYGPVTNGAGTVIGSLGTFLQTNLSILAAPMAKEAVTTISKANLGTIWGQADDPIIGDLIYIGTGTDAQCEIAMITGLNNSTQTYTLRRGCFDTVPRAWPVNTRLWHVNDTWGAYDDTERLAPAAIPYKMTPRTTKSVLPLSAAPQDTLNTVPRPYLPFRPANVKVDGVDIFSATGKVYLATPASIPITWANRNRLMEDTVVKSWTDGNVTPEDGQLTGLRLRSDTGVVLTTINDLPGTSYNLDPGVFGGEPFAYLELFSKRDGLESLQNAIIQIELRLYGYGYSYGEDYGENDGY
ncbi:MAG: hypothetical protein DI533_20255 [Cereibacter sphaeroides]|uniref:Tip attachment protein J domain-containing protein n=1 Tax=Cereibacter sphaeroides TaxID=1063 RepID=A0A2W5RZ94_CERSP|nr:MAG: hypothetical protein DI533_20255 [Cereibacter sphaeroides]